MHNSHPGNRALHLLGDLLVVFAALAILVGLLLPALQALR
jgi:hypothetical protein